MKVLLFGVLADVVGKSVVETEALPDVEKLKAKLTTEYPLLNNYSFQIAVNMEKIQKNTSLSSDDEIALLPPYAGG